MIKSRRKRWAEFIAHMGEMGNVYRILIRKSKERRPFGRQKHG
jgi:hypothetical protein